jgi:hypothetical protein
MIKIANDKLFSLTEVLSNVRTYVEQEKITDVETGAFNFEIKILSIALDEPEDFIRGALRPDRKRN